MGLHLIWMAHGHLHHCPCEGRSQQLWHLPVTFIALPSPRISSRDDCILVELRVTGHPENEYVKSKTHCECVFTFQGPYASLKDAEGLLHHEFGQWPQFLKRLPRWRPFVERSVELRQVTACGVTDIKCCRNTQAGQRPLVPQFVTLTFSCCLGDPWKDLEQRCKVGMWKTPCVLNTKDLSG